MATKKAIAELDSRSTESLLAEFHTAPYLPYGDPYADRLRAILKERRLADPDGYLRLSREIGW